MSFWKLTHEQPCYGSETFLSRRVPNLKFYLFARHLNDSRSKLHSDSVRAVGGDWKPKSGVNRYCCNSDRRYGSLHFCSVNWCNRHDLPTPMSPTMMYLNMYEYCEEVIFGQHLWSTATTKEHTAVRKTVGRRNGDTLPPVYSRCGPTETGHDNGDGTQMAQATAAAAAATSGRPTGYESRVTGRDDRASS